jgi:hypothetical protein
MKTTHKKKRNFSINLLNIFKIFRRFFYFESMVFQFIVGHESPTKLWLLAVAVVSFVIYLSCHVLSMLCWVALL